MLDQTRDANSNDVNDYTMDRFENSNKTKRFGTHRSKSYNLYENQYCSHPGPIGPLSTDPDLGQRRKWEDMNIRFKRALHGKSYVRIESGINSNCNDENINYIRCKRAWHDYSD